YSGGEFRGLTIMSHGRTAIESSNENGARIYLNPNGANVHVADADDNYHGISASKFNQSSSRKQKHDIKDLQDNALEVINSLEIKEYLRKTSGKITNRDRWQVGILVEESPSQLLADGDSVDLYTYQNYTTRALQQHYEITTSQHEEVIRRLEKLERTSQMDNKTDMKEVME